MKSTQKNIQILFDHREFYQNMYLKWQQKKYETPKSIKKTRIHYKHKFCHEKEVDEMLLRHKIMKPKYYLVKRKSGIYDK